MFIKGSTENIRCQFLFTIRVFFTLILFGICYTVYPQTSPENGHYKTSGNYRIGVGDILKVDVARQAQLSLDRVRVNNDGNIRLPQLDEDIPAACLTEVELAAVIAEKYRKFLKSPQVLVVVQEFNSNPVAFIGAVTTPGRFDLRRPTRLLELLALVNGPTGNAGKKIQIIRRLDLEQCVDNRMTRPQPEVSQTLISVPLEETILGKENANPYVQAGDIITIAEAEAPDKAYIIGNVKNPRELSLVEPTTLSKAIAMSGGTSQGAKIKKIKIMREDPKTLSKLEITANLEAINKGEEEDILLQDNDIIDVPGPKPSLLDKILRPIIPIVTRGIIPVP